MAKNQSGSNLKDQPQPLKLKDNEPTPLTAST